MKLTLSLKAMLIGVLATLTLLIIGIGGLAYIQLGQTYQSVNDLGDNWLPSVDRINAINTNTSDLRIAEGTHVMSINESDMSEAEAAFAAILKEMQANQVIYERLISSDEERKTYESFKGHFGEYVKLHDELFMLSRANRNVEAAELFRGEMKTRYDTFSNELLRLIDINRKGAAQSRQSAANVNREATTVLVTAILAALGLAGAGVWLILARVTAPLSQITRMMQVVSEGKLDSEIPHTQTRNEIGALARTLLIFRDGLRETQRMREESELMRVRTEEDRRRAMLKLADDFEASVGQIVAMVSSAATEMQASAAQLTATAQETAAQSVAVSSAAEEAGTNVTSVASAAEEMGASVSEIGRQVASSAQTSRAAVAQADSAAEVVNELSEVAASINGIVDLIAGLAGQTNLLALNATIESARAGEAGKGFAVVASEVKALAGQTAKATTDISARIGQIQEATSKAATAFRTITSTIQNIDTTNAMISAAVEQQSAATQEIIQAVNQASLGTQEVTLNITGVAQASGQTGDAAAQVLSSSGELAQQAERLRREMDQFLSTVRAA